MDLIFSLQKYEKKTSILIKSLKKHKKIDKHFIYRDILRTFVFRMISNRRLFILNFSA